MNRTFTSGTSAAWNSSSPLGTSFFLTYCSFLFGRCKYITFQQNQWEGHKRSKNVHQPKWLEMFVLWQKIIYSHMTPSVVARNWVSGPKWQREKHLSKYPLCYCTVWPAKTCLYVSVSLLRNICGDECDDRRGDRAISPRLQLYDMGQCDQLQYSWCHQPRCREGQSGCSCHLHVRIVSGKLESLDSLVWKSHTWEQSSHWALLFLGRCAVKTIKRHLLLRRNTSVNKIKYCRNTKSLHRYCIWEEVLLVQLRCYTLAITFACLSKQVCISINVNFMHRSEWASSMNCFPGRLLKL